jgi:chromosome segregation ATPase
MLAQLPRDMKGEIYEAKIAAAEREIDALHLALSKERRAAVAMKAQMHATVTSHHHQQQHQQQQQQQHPSSGAGTFSHDNMEEIQLPEGEGSREKMKMLVRRMNEMRRESQLEITRLKDYIAQVEGTEMPVKEELVRLRHNLTEAKDQLQRCVRFDVLIVTFAYLYSATVPV